MDKVERIRQLASGRHGYILLNAIIWDMVPDDQKERAFKASNIYWKLASRESQEHDRWLRGGVHPAGTPEREASDRRRQQIYARRCRLMGAMRSIVLQAAGLPAEDRKKIRPPIASL